jgi:hypothetical protein
LTIEAEERAGVQVGCPAAASSASASFGRPAVGARRLPSARAFWRWLAANIG